MSLSAITDANFAELSAKSLLLIVDCHAQWCAPCRTLKPIMEQLGEALKGTATVAMLDVEAAPVTANAHNVRAVPTLLAFKKGKLVGTKNAQLTRAGIEQWVASL